MLKFDDLGNPETIPWKSKKGLIKYNGEESLDWRAGLDTDYNYIKRVFEHDTTLSSYPRNRWYKIYREMADKVKQHKMLTGGRKFGKIRLF